MATGEWIPLQNFSVKYGISLSTLRRRIKANTIPFKLEHGKYFILDEDSKGAQSPEPRSTSPTAHESLTVSEIHSPSFVEASVLSSANRLVEEIKAAYAKIL